MKSLVFVLGLLPNVVLAHGSVIDVASGATVEVLAQFKANESAEVKKSFRGVKVWPSGDKMLAKVYLDQNGSESALNYSCMMDHSSGRDQIVCQKQN